MGKDRSRKPRLRTRREQIDDDLAVLATAIGESAEPVDLNGWLSLPWRSGWNAAELALQVWLSVPASLKRGEAISRALRLAVAERRPLAKVYEQAEDFRNESVELFLRGCRYSSLLVACARCIQLEIANSSGGGEVFNDVLRTGLQQLDRDGHLLGAGVNVDLAAHFLEARCLDALGTTARMCNDNFDRKRRAFAIAWNRGLYKAAYSIRGVQ